MSLWSMILRHISRNPYSRPSRLNNCSLIAVVAINAKKNIQKVH